MSFLIRKIESQKWKQTDIFNGADVSADAITGSLRTTGNTLSLWEVYSEEEINEAILAIVSHFDKADTIDIVKIKPSDLEEKSLEYERTEGLTAYEPFKKRHFNIKNLSYEKLGSVADIIVTCLRDKAELRIRRKEIKDLIINSIEDGKIKKENLKQKLIEDLGLAG